MRYVKVHWLHDLPDEPTVLLSEIDEGRWERRKVYLFRQGPAGIASATESTRSVILGEKPLPTLEEIGSDPQFKPEEITREEFETAWLEARR